MIRFIVFCFAVLTLISGILCEIVPQLACDNGEARLCEIHEMRISPCKEALKTPAKPCKFKKGRNVSLEVDFTPSFNADVLKAQMYWVNGFIDPPLKDMVTEACLTTTCPTVKDKQQMYTYVLPVASYFPLSTYNVKLVILDKNDEDNHICCGIFTIQIAR